MLPIFNQEPSNWQDLQIKVAKIFSDIGFETEIEKDIKLVRGTVNVDVYASKKFHNINEIHIAECKYWSTPIPQNVVHAFRTVISDSGANTGYIISRKGFQDGSYKAIENSNISILTFDEFQNEFKIRWLEAVVDNLEQLGYPLRKYADPMEDFYDKELAKLSEEKQKEFYSLMKKYELISFATFRQHYCNAISGQLELDYIEPTIDRYLKYFVKGIQVNCLMDYFDYLKNVSIAGVAEFDNLFGKKVRKR